MVEQATKIQVQLDGDPNKYTAKVIGVDEDTDLAVIKIEATKDLPTAKLGNSDGVNVGDWVLAIGSPFGLNATVTAGIISAKDRSGIGGSNHQFQRFFRPTRRSTPETPVVHSSISPAKSSASTPRSSPAAAAMKVSASRFPRRPQSTSTTRLFRKGASRAVRSA